MSATGPPGNSRSIFFLKNNNNFYLFVFGWVFFPWIFLAEPGFSLVLGSGAALRLLCARLLLIALASPVAEYRI